MPPLTNQELLEKATLTTVDFGGAGEAPLAIEVADEFIRKLTIGQQLLGDVHTVTHRAPKWQQGTVQFTNRVLRPGVQAARLADADRVKPTSGLIEMNTQLVKGEVPVADEVFEDNITGERFADAMDDLIADRVGLDVEELAISGDVASGDAYLALLDGFLKQATGAGGHVFNATATGQDFQEVLKQLLVSLPERAKRNIESEGRFYAPSRLIELYRDILATRGTPLGDLSLAGKEDIRYQGIILKPIATIPVTAGAPDTSSVLLTNRNNLYVGFQRRVSIETFRDPREGATSFIVTARLDAKVADVDATAVATNVNVEPS